MVDNTNRNNIKMFITYMLVFFICIILVMVMSVFFGTKQHDSITSFYNKPAKITCFHDHRL